MRVIGPIDYSSRDYSSLVVDLQAAAPLLLPEWSSQSAFDFGTVLLDLYAYVGDIMNYYIDRVANELFLSTATRRQSVLNIAKMLNYVPVASAAAKTTLTFTLVPGSTEVVIPKATRVTTVPLSGSAPVIFETDNDLTISGTDAATPVFIGTVNSTQGVTINDEMLSAHASGSVNQEYTLYTPDVIEGSVSIEVLDSGGILTIWTPVQSLLTQTPGDRTYELGTDENDVVHVFFGDNVHGLAPPLGSMITASYRFGIGQLGNVAQNTITEVVEPVAGVLSVNNALPAVGGTDPESVESIRTNIPASLYALQRAVTLADYAALAIQVPGIAKAQATSQVYTSVLLFIAPVGPGGQSATGPDTEPGTQKYAVQRYFDDKKLINVSITLANPLYIGIDINADVAVLSNYYQPTVKNAVMTSLSRLLSYEKVDFAQDVTISQVYHAIQNTGGVDWCKLTLLVRNDAATHSGVQDALLGTGEIPQAGIITLTMSGGVL